MMNFTEAYSHTCSTVGAATRLGDLVTLQQLIWNGNSVDVQDNRGWRPIHEAAYNGHPGCLELLLRQEATNVDWVSFEEESSLLLASRTNNIDCIKVLLNFQANPNVTTHEGFSPLWEASKIGALSACKLLVMRGADVNAQTYTKSTAMHEAAERGHNLVLDFLLNHNGRLDVFADHHLSPIFLTAQFGRSECLISLLKFASNRGQLSIVNEVAKDNASPLLIAAQEGHEDCILLLLDAGADANIAVREVDALPLQYAVYSGHLNCVKLLLPVTQLLKLQHHYKEMHPLLQALRHENLDMLKTLLTSRLDPSLSLPFDREQLTEFSPLIIDIAPSVNGSILCHIKDDFPTNGVRFLLQTGLSPNSQADRDLPPLLVMLWNKNPMFYRLFLEHGAIANIYYHNIVGNVAMLLALRNDIHKAESVKCSYDCPYDSPIYLEYTWPLIVAGGEAISLFTASSSDFMDTGKISLLHLLKTQDKKSSLPIVGFLLFFCHFVNVSREILDLFEPEDAKVLQKISASTSSLAHICRRRIVLELAANKRFNKQTLDSIPVPSTVSEYLSFTEFGSLGHFVLDMESSAT